MGPMVSLQVRAQSSDNFFFFLNYGHFVQISDVDCTADSMKLKADEKKVFSVSSLDKKNKGV